MPELLFVLFLISPYSSQVFEVRVSIIISLQIGPVTLIEQNNLNTKQQQQKSYCIYKYLHMH
jgi:hypothetical protein